MTEGRVHCFETCLFLVDFSRCFLNNLLHASALASLLGMTQNSPMAHLAIYKGEGGDEGQVHALLPSSGGWQGEPEGKGGVPAFLALKVGCCWRTAPTSASLRGRHCHLPFLQQTHGFSLPRNLSASRLPETERISLLSPVSLGLRD